MEDQSEALHILVKIGAVFLIGVIILSGVVANKTLDSINMTLTKIPADGETIKINGNTYEFDNDNNVNSGNIPVAIAATLNETGYNFESVIADNSDLLIGNTTTD
jgi:restriction endonuclease S subunit